MACFAEPKVKAEPSWEREARLEERARIAQELHDTVLQGFLSAAMQLSVAVNALALDSPVKPLLERVQRVMGESLEEGRRAIQGLRCSSYMSGLAEALSRIPEELALGNGVGFRVVVAGPQPPLLPGLRHEIYRIGREALLNAFRHSHASRIELEFEYAARELVMLIRDNGRGIAPHVLRAGNGGRWGLAGMRERATRIGGRLSVRSNRIEGTEIQLRVPFASSVT